MYEKRHQKLIPLNTFVIRVLRALVIGLIIIVLSLYIGMAGYAYFEDMPLVDAYVNAAMILSGMGPLSPIETEGGKIFAGTYSLFSGIIFLVVIAWIFAPAVHRFMHKFHIQDLKEK